MNKIGLYTLYIKEALNEKVKKLSCWNTQKASIDGKYYYFDVTWDDQPFK